MNNQAVTILVIDKKMDNCEYIAGLFEQEGFVVAQANTKTDGLTAAKTKNPYLVIVGDLEASSDGLNGNVGLIRSLKADTSTAKIPLFVISCDAGAEAIAHYFELGVDDCVSTPVFNWEVLARSKRLLKKSLDFPSEIFEMSRDPQYQIALSFAGEDRPYVDQVANLLRSSGIKVFYDLFEEASLWGKNLYDYLSDVYKNRALYTIMFISKNYAEKLWPTHERQAMQARAFQEHKEYVLPARFDSTAIPGVLPTVAYISLEYKKPQELVELIHKKLIDAGRTIPSEQLRKSVYSFSSAPRIDPTVSAVHVLDEDYNPLEGATVTAIADNNTFKVSISSELGEAKFRFQTRQKLRVLIAHPNRAGAIFQDWDPVQDLQAWLPMSENLGSVICHGTVSIPGLEGRLNPILDTSKRMYLYANNIAIRDGEQQPASFSLGMPIKLEDSNGVVMYVTVLHIQGQTSLIQYNHNPTSDA
jgi:hypothetical protein